MIKGINRQMIEVDQPDSPYFERALFVVRADSGENEWDVLQAQAAQTIRQTGSYSALRRGRWRYCLTRCAWVLTGGGFGLLLGLLIGKGL